MVSIARVWEARSALARPGWHLSRWHQRPLDGFGRPIPSLSYSAIAVLRRSVRQGLQVFEYGSGYSTVWWSNQGCSVIACEHDPKWANEVSKLAPKADVRLRDLDNGYVEEIGKAGGPFDIVVIDGRRRVACAKMVAPYLASHTIVVFDDTHRDYYAPGLLAIQACGFKRRDFLDFSPANGHRTQTSLFYYHAQPYTA